MTEENRRRNIEDEVARARLALRAVEALLGLGLHADSISRAYYAVFHWIRALPALEREGYLRPAS